MNHVKWAAAVLVLIVIISSWGEYVVRKDCRELTDMLNSLQTAAREENESEKERLCSEISDKWQSSRMLFMLAVPLEKISQAEQSICRLEPLLAVGSDELEAEAAAAAACCDVICR